MWPVGRTNNAQTAFTGVRMNTNENQRTGQRAWADQQQSVQTPGVQWNTQAAASGGQWAATTAQAQTPASQGLVAWPTTQQPWSSTTTASNTYAEHAKKASSLNVRNQASGARFEQLPQAWGAVKVEQGTPWDTGNASVIGDAGLAVHGTDVSKTEWGAAAVAAVAAPAAASRWNMVSGPQWGPLASSSAADWVHHRQDPNAHWNKQQMAGTGLVPSTAIPAASWVQSQATVSETADQYDPNPQTPGPWVAPQPAELNNDMMWHDPNPKQKKVQRDTGTSVWGDPTQQSQEIRRWKDVEIGDYTHVQSATSSGGDWSTIPISSSAFNSINNSQNPVSSTPTSGNGNGGWNNCTLGEQHISGSTPAAPLQDCQEKWTAPSSQSSGWGDSVKAENAGENVQMSSGLVRLAVAKGLIDMPSVNRPLPSNTQAAVSTLMQKMSKLEQAQQEYTQVLRAVSSPAQKVECERLVMEINDLQQEIMHLRSSVDDHAMKRMSTVNGTIPMSPPDGQSRLNQWKQPNTEDCDRLPASSSDVNVPALIASAQNLSLDEKGDWKSGTLDWSPPGSTSGAKERTQSVVEKEEETTEKLTASQTQSATGTPTPQIDDGPQEFVPGKKWEWRDPNKVAEDPNATPGNCKPNPLLSSSNAAPFQAMYGRGAVTQNYLTDLPINKGATGYIGWNGLPTGNNYTSELWAANRSSRAAANVYPQQMQIGGPISHNSFQRSFSSPTHRQYCSVPWIFIQLHNITQDQAQLLCQKAGTLAQVVTTTSFPWLFLKFREPVEDVARHLREIAPYLQFKLVSDGEMDRMMRMRAPPTTMIPVSPLGWNTPGLPTADPSAAWMFGAGTMALPSSEVLQVAQQQQQQHAFHTDDLSRPF